MNDQDEDLFFRVNFRHIRKRNVPQVQIPVKLPETDHYYGEKWNDFEKVPWRNRIVRGQIVHLHVFRIEPEGGRNMPRCKLCFSTDSSNFIDGQVCYCTGSMAYMCYDCIRGIIEHIDQYPRADDGWPLCRECGGRFRLVDMGMSFREYLQMTTGTMLESVLGTIIVLAIILGVLIYVALHADVPESLHRLGVFLWVCAVFLMAGFILGAIYFLVDNYYGFRTRHLAEVNGVLDVNTEINEDIQQADLQDQHNFTGRQYALGISLSSISLVAFLYLHFYVHIFKDSFELEMLKHMFVLAGICLSGIILMAMGICMIDDYSGAPHVAIQMNDDGVEVQGNRRMRSEDYGAMIGIGILFLVLSLSLQFFVHIPPEYGLFKTIIVLLFGLGALTMFGIVGYTKLTEPGRPAIQELPLRVPPVLQKEHGQKEHGQKEPAHGKQNIGLFH